ncbi:hypothetical protein BH11BAC2_BH11BAC2_03440 [soil metagenome]
MVKKDKDQSTEKNILNAAREIFQQKGLAGARMQDIADRAGINKAMLHYYFRTKEKLFEVIFQEALEKFLPRLQIIFGEEGSLFEKIELFVGEYIDLLLDNPQIPMFVLNQISTDPETFFSNNFSGNRQIPFQMMMNVFEKEMEQGNIRVVHPKHLIVNIMSLSVFPFVARPMLQRVMGVTDVQYRKFLTERKQEVINFIIHSLKA